MRLILDSSVIAKLFLKEKNSDDVIDMIDLGFSKDVTFLASELVLYEVGNVFWKHLRNKDKDGRELIKQLFLLNINYIPLDSDLAIEVMKVSLKNNITFYDSVHIVLAKRYQIELVTEDKNLLKKFDTTINIIEALKKIKEEISTAPNIEV